MKKIIPVVLAAASICFLVAAYYPNKNGAEKEAVIMQTFLTGINQLHYSPKKLDDDFSKKAFDSYLKRLDGGKRFLTINEINKLKQYELSIDDQAQAGNYDCFNLSLQLLEEGINKTEKIYKDLLAQPFDFAKDETVELDGDKKAWAKDDNELKDYWRKSLKYTVLSKVMDKMEEQDKPEFKEAKKSMADLEKDARAKVLKDYDDWYKRMRKMKRSDHLSDFINSLSNVFDPHTEYYEPKDKEVFDMNMSGRFEGIGARLQSMDDYTKVSDIIPGGPAWKKGELKENDLILKVAQGEAEPVDIAGMALDDVVKMIKGKKGTEVRLTVKKVDGSTKVLSIIRDEVIVDESFARSLILSNEKNDKIGYIKLPKFYADFEKADGRSCAQDVAHEIEALKKQQVQGIVLDLRNNGGGSLRDVVDMSGLFIEKGPIVQVKSRRGQPEILSDTDPAVQYNGPLIVMVNQMSASASEILAAALQDYGRAIIVGAKGTYGKGTVQRFFDLDRAIPGNSDIKPLGEVKMTVQKFYRINGGSTQLRGVTPDIVLPDNYNYLQLGEEDNDFPMAWTEIPAAQFSSTQVITSNKLGKIKSASDSRVKNNPTFKLIDENAKRLQKQKDDNIYPLSFEKFKAEKAKLNAESKKYEDMLKPIDKLKAENLAENLEYIKVDSSRIARNDDWMKNVKKDVQLYEALMIMHDMIIQNASLANSKN